MTQTGELVEKWRNLGPVAWAESPYGWVGDDGRPIVLADWQRAALDAWWAHRADVSTFAISAPKKAGKTFCNAVLTAWRWLSLPGTHFCVANDFDQATARQFAEVAKMCQRNPFLRQHVKATRSQLVFEPTGSELIALPADYAGASGANFITASHTETWAVLYEQARRLVEELTPIPGAFYGLPCLRVCDSYAGYEGESDFWHGIVDRGLAGDRLPGDWPIYRNGGLLLFHVEGDDGRRCFRGTPAEAEAYYQEQRATLRPNAYTRLHENRRTASIGNLCDPDDWQALIDPTHTRLEPGAREELRVGLDLATAPGGDNAACVAVFADRDKRVRLAWHKLWKGAERKEQLKLTETVLPFLLDRARQYRVTSLYMDPWQGQALAELLRGRMHVVEVPQTHSGRGPYDSRLVELIKNRALVLYDDPDVRTAAAGVAVKELPDGRSFLQKAGRLKVDFVIALALAVGDVGTMRHYRGVRVIT